MIKSILFTLFAFALFACEAETAAAVEVPAVVQSAFEASYPGATDVEWEEDGDHYEVEFEFNGEEFEMEYSALGEPMEMEED
ncbi:hypothetical protein LEM8419_03342 [Neolewinella maritima]|uniref:PepSY domain-containing protein n=1 Tax=Neolewinella maritima TaxID=1383882 RepID=A0ABN8F8T6_9BACT|nr:hypothetical protein [Neolewinella maritima]CAH1002463.1 hypothetical protein LEM8419_03342 [Neolewinella maritima]